MDWIKATDRMCGGWWEWQLQGEPRGESVTGHRGRRAESVALENKYITHWDPQPPRLSSLSVVARIFFVMLKMLEGTKRDKE